MTITKILCIIFLISCPFTNGDGCKNCFNDCRRGDECDHFGCKPGYYGTACDNLCSNNCAYGGSNQPVCNRTTGGCLSGCEKGFYGKTCQENCPRYCSGKVCTQDEGFCIQGCEKHFHGMKCNQNCNRTCNDLLCDRNGICPSCKQGYWGLFCENECSGNCKINECRMTLDGRTECTRGCLEGWTGSNCDVLSAERKHEHRNRRDASEICDYFDKTDNCECCESDNKPVNESCVFCKNCVSRFNTITSKCDRLCRDGFHGIDNLCRESCSENCFHSQKNVSLCNAENGDCNNCPPGRYGDKCESECSKRCLKNECARNAYCLNCSNTTYGNHCDTPCSSNCLDAVCERWEGNCTDGCKSGYYGFYCDKNCSSQCQESDCSMTIFGKFECTFGCRDGYWGKYCTDNCEVNCSRCHQNNGTCLHDCRCSRYAGVDQNPPTNSRKTQSEDFGLSSLEKGLIATVLMLLMVIAVLSIVIFRMCRRGNTLRSGGAGQPESVPFQSPSNTGDNRSEDEG